jgi:glycosyltransferase involved in cell wall biosynthesis
MTIGVVLATYNGERFIQEQLESIAAQSRPPDDMVVVDDNSSDSTVEAIRSFASSVCFPVRLRVNEMNLGSTPSFAKAIEHCNSDILVTCDQDDIWHPEKLRKFDDAFRRTPDAGLAVCNAEAVDEQSLPVGKDLFSLHGFNKRRQQMTLQGQAMQVFLRTAPSGNAMAFRGSFKNAIMPIPDTWSHDIWISLLIAAIDKVIIIPDRLTMYRQHSDNQVGLVQLSLSKRVAKSRAHGMQFYKDEVARYETLRERIREKHPNLENHLIRQIDAKIDHMRVRANMPSKRVFRILPIITELTKGHYQSYSGNGLLSAVRDMML